MGNGRLHFEEEKGHHGFLISDFLFLLNIEIRGQLMRAQQEYEDILRVEAKIDGGEEKDFGVKVVLGIVSPEMCLLLPFLHSPTLPLGQQSWGTEDSSVDKDGYDMRIDGSLIKLKPLLKGQCVIFQVKYIYIYFFLPVKALLSHA